jgi:hypothetical protein
VRLPKGEPWRFAVVEEPRPAHVAD